VTFDCYGTLVDWTRGLTDALREEVGDGAPAVLTSTLAFAFALEQARPHRSYREILTESLRRAAAQEGMPVRRDDLLVEAWADLPVFGDVPPCLERLRRVGWRLGVLTNCDDDLFVTTAASLVVPFDEVVTAEQVQAYKPAPTHFREFQRRTEASAAEWVHVANSWLADIVPTRQLGIPRVWVNRDRDQNDSSFASVTLPDFTALPTVLGQLLPRSHREKPTS
jgi:2-haloacid dehalogenase